MVSQDERLKTCTCYCFQDSPERERLVKKRRDTVESEEVVGAIKREKGGDSDSTMKRWREKREEDRCVSRVCLPICVLVSISLLCAFVDHNNMIKA